MSQGFRGGCRHLGTAWAVLAVGLALPSSARAQAGAPAPPDGFDPSLSFHRAVVPVLSRLGCNAGGACHGTVLGQNGFRLSLFGGDPAADYQRLTREAHARRVNPLRPDESLVLLKATGQVEHGGGRRTEVGGSDYEVLRRWIAAGAPPGDPAGSRVVRLSVSPATQEVRAGESCRLRVTAGYADGTSADVTRLCRYEPQDGAVVSVSPSGEVQGHRTGDTAIVIRYGAEPALANILVVPAGVAGAFPDVRPHNFIDELILARLKALGLPPAKLCDDATFLRRLRLDVTGALPEPEEVRAFLASKDPGRRARKIDEVLASPGYAELWAAKLSDLLKPVEKGNDGSNNIQAGQLLRIRFFEWLRSRLGENVPYDQLAERILVSSSLEGRSVEQWLGEWKEMQAELAGAKSRPLGQPLLSAYSRRRTLDLFWQRDGAVGVIGAVQFAHAFLGLRLQCAQCHRHPQDVWQQDDLLSFANFFTAVRSPVSPGPNSTAVAEAHDRVKGDLQKWAEEIKGLARSKEPADRARLAELQGQTAAYQALLAGEVAPVLSGTIRPAAVSNSLGTQQSSTLRLLGETKPVELAPGQDRRTVVMSWLRRPDNPFFARAIVNRVWAHYLGRGLVDPVDHLSPLNPPSHPELLEALCRGFLRSGYDLKWLHRTILNSRTYQQSHEADGPAAEDERSYARFYLRRLPGEVILDSLNGAAGAAEKYSSVWMFREGERAVLVAGVMVDVVYYRLATEPFRYLVFGRERRRPTVQCDCEQGREVTLPQLLYLANHPEVRQKIEAKDGRVARLAGDARLDDRRCVEELFLRALGRPPGDPELKAGVEHVRASASRRKGLEDVLWSLVNTREFQMNY